MDEVIEKNTRLFRSELGKLNSMETKICVPSNAQPRYFKPRPVPYSLRDKVDRELERLLKAGVISPVQFSDWATPIVPFVKSDVSICICGDYKVTVNAVSKLEEYPLPRVEDLFAALSGGKVFSKLDLSHAYQQLVLEEDSKKFTIINTQKGLFQFERLPFGISSTPAIFQQTIESLLQVLPGVVAYINDILVTRKSEQEHLEHIENLTRVLNCQEGLHPSEEKVRAIKQAPRLRNVTELKSFFGLLNYYSKFLPHLSTLLSPLYHLLRKDGNWSCKKLKEDAFNKAK